jgi:hypothetical protein
MFPRAISVEFRRPVLTLDIALPTSLPELHYFWEAALQEHNVDSIGVRSENVASAVCELKKSPSNRLEDTGLLEIRRCPADPVVESWLAILEQLRPLIRGQLKLLGEELDSFRKDVLLSISGEL